MKTALELFNELQPELESLDKERIKTVKRILILDAVFILLFLFQFPSINQKVFTLLGFDSGYSFRIESG